MNRTQKAMLNAVIVLISSIIQMIFMLIRTKSIINVYGTEINGLIQTVKQIETYLLLIESGLCSAYLYYMYRPISKHEYNELSSLYKGFCASLKNTALKMCFCALLGTLLLPIILNKDNTIGFLNIIVISLLINMRFIIPYFYSIAPQYMLVAKEEKYKNEFILLLRECLVYIIEIFLLYKKINILIVLSIGILMNIVFTFIFKYVMNKSYAYKIKKSVEKNTEPDSMKNDILVHQVSRLVFNSTDNIVLSMFTSLNTVTIYSSYNMIVSNAITIINKVVEGVRASLAIKINKNHNNSFDVFSQMLAISLFLGIIISSVFVVMVNKFIVLWIGEGFLISQTTVILFGIVLYQSIILPISNIARDAKGLYKESKGYTVFQSVLNLTISLLLVNKLGITGVLIGTIIGRGLVTLPCNYKLVYKKVFHRRRVELERFIFSIIIICINIFISLYVVNNVITLSNITYLTFIIETVVVTLITTVTTIILMFISDNGFKSFCKKLVLSLNKK